MYIYASKKDAHGSGTPPISVPRTKGKSHAVASTSACFNPSTHAELIALQLNNLRLIVVVYSNATIMEWKPCPNSSAVIQILLVILH